MKSLIKYSIAVIFIAGLVIGCNNLPEYPLEPSITFNDVYFKKGELTDSLFVVLDFKDGDGDLGLASTENDYPYHTFWYFLKNDGTYLTYDDRNTPPYDTLPPYEFPYFCTNYSEEPDSLIYYVQPNENHFNYFVDFYVKRNGAFELYDWITANPPNCGETYNGRYPILNESGNDRPLEGKLIYKMTGLGFEAIFKRDTLKLEVHIKDRALHNSNTVQSFEFVLRDITVN